MTEALREHERDRREEIRFPGYEVIEKLGEGGMGAVFKARDTQLDRVVAIKILRSDATSHLLQEARAAARLNHPNIIQTHAVNERHNPPFFVMEFIGGATLAQSRRRPGALEVAALLEKLARAVHYAHSRGVVHRDLKPSNIALSENGEPKILDFGIARLGQSQDPPTDGFAGTPLYAAPEQFDPAAPHGPALDIYGLGAILYEQLTGHPPFVATSTSDLIDKIRHDNPMFPRERAPEVPEPLQRICLNALERDARKRYPTALEMADDLRRFIEGVPVLARPTLYDSALEGKVRLHLDDIARWHGEQLIDHRERDRLVRTYQRILPGEIEWLGALRRIRASQVFLYLGGLLILLGCGTWMIQYWDILTSAERIIGLVGPCAILYGIGLYLWRQGRTGTGVAFLLASGFLVAPSFAVVFSQFAWFGWKQSDWEMFDRTFTNSQMLIASALGLGWALWMLHRFKAAAFSTLVAILAVAAYMTAWFVLGLKPLLDEEQFAAVGLRILPLPIILGVVGTRWIGKTRPKLASPFYALGLAGLFGGLSLIAGHAPEEWLGERGSDAVTIAKLLFMAPAAIYFGMALSCDRWGNEPMRFFAVFLFLATPPSVLVPLHLLEGDGPVVLGDFRLYELLLPAAALAFAILSVPLQIRAFLYAGLAYVAVSVQRLTFNHFEEERAWALSLIASGLAAMLLVLLAQRLRRGKIPDH
ncbi:MAG: DUF2157 domain-containing protein [Planctomycetes bacterium]|nr:DUF2157 domain-containing protein [Planctomycetota bacterium]